MDENANQSNRQQPSQGSMPESRLNEALSALMDGEADELEVRRLLRELPAQPELAAAWKRYHTVRASLQQEVHVEPRVDLLKGIHARLAAEQDTAFGTPMAGVLRSRLVRHLGQGAIAASVAMAALMSVSLFEVADNGGAAAPAIADAGTAPAVNNGFATSPQPMPVALDAEEFSRLQQAVLREFSEQPQQIPVSYQLEMPAELTPAE